MAIINPLGGYTRPPRLGWSLPNLKPIALAILAAGVWLADAASDRVTVTDEGGVLFESDAFGWEAALILIALVGIVFASVSRWWMFRWWIEGDSIQTSGGILHRWTRGTTIDRVVTVDRSTTPIARLFRVSRVAIETTAMHQSEPDILLGYLSNRDAQMLERLLVSRLVLDGDAGEEARLEPRLLGRLGWWDLIVAGATTIQMSRALITLWAASQFLAYLAIPTPSIVVDSETGAYGLGPIPLAIVAAAGLVSVLWLASALYFIVSFARFRLGRQAGWLTVETGVIRPVRRLIRVDAIQGLEISRSPLQRRFRSKRAMLRMRMPAYGAPPNYAMVLHPAVTDASIPGLTAQIMGMDAATSRALCGQGVHRLATGSRGAYIVSWTSRVVAASGALLLLLLLVQPDRWWWSLILLSLSAPCAGLGLLAWSSAGWHADSGEWLVLQRGVLGLTSTAARVDRIQYLRWSLPLAARSPANASLAVSVATSGGAGFITRLLTRLHRPVNPSLVTLRAVSAADARAIATASGHGSSLPPAWLPSDRGRGDPNDPVRVDRGHLEARRRSG